MISIALVFFLAVIPAIVLHEFAHAWAADRLGDPTARRMGRLSIDPLKHVDLFGTIILPLLLYLPYALHWTSSPIIFGYAKPVPFDPMKLRHPKLDIMFVRLAGPLMNMMIALVLSRVLLVVHAPLAEGVLATAVVLNIGLAVFNMIPVPPLDGSGVLYALVPARYLHYLARMDNMAGIVVVFVMLNLGWLSFLDRIIYSLVHAMGV